MNPEQNAIYNEIFSYYKWLALRSYTKSKGLTVTFLHLSKMSKCSPCFVFWVVTGADGLFWVPNGTDGQILIEEVPNCTHLPSLSMGSYRKQKSLESWFKFCKNNVLPGIIQGSVRNPWTYYIRICQ